MAVLAATLPVVSTSPDSLLRCLWPAFVAVGVIALVQQATVGLACGVASAALLLTGGQPVESLRLTLESHLFPSMQGPWRVGALVFTLLLGSFASMLERSGGFETILRNMLAHRGHSEKKLLGGIYLIGLLCFFDGLASSLLTGRIARPLADHAGVSRERLAWAVDSTGSPVACVAFISTWIATQLSLIEQGLRDAPFPVEPYAMFFQAVPANAYCLLTLWLVPLAIWIGHQPRAMRRFHPTVRQQAPMAPADLPGAHTVLVPVFLLIVGILGAFPLLAGHPIDMLTLEGWKQAFSSDAGPYALVFGSGVGWLAALLCFPTARKHEAVEAAVQGAGSLLPALVVLLLAWTLGSLFTALGTTQQIAGLLSSGIPVSWLPLVIFLLGAAMAFTTGSSWGTMGLLMPLALPAVITASSAAGLSPEDCRSLSAMVISAVFGGATLGDHCSPFSDTTIVSALASGCRTMDHVMTQLPYAGMTAAMTCSAYALMAAGLAPAMATLAAALGLTGWLIRLRRQPVAHRPRPTTPE